jgi:hypothetical protein
MIGTDNIKDLIENAYLQQKQLIETSNTYFKNVVENAYFQHRQMMETNAMSLENYVRMFGNDDDLIGNLQNTKRDFLNFTDQSKEKLLNSLDQIRDDLLSNALKTKENYGNGVNAFKSAVASKEVFGKTKAD